MATARTRSISTKVTEGKYGDIVDRACPRTVSKRTREFVLSAVHPDPLRLLVLAEVVALRTSIRELTKRKALSGAGYGDRTRLSGLGSQGITTMLSPPGDARPDAAGTPF